MTHRLSHTGVLTAATRTALQALANLPTGFSDAVGVLFARSQDIVMSFFTLHPELQPFYDAYRASAAPIPQKRLTLLTGLRPVLAAARKRQQALQRLSTAASVSLDFATALLDPGATTTPPVYPLHAANDPERPVLDDVVALQTPGLTASFYYRPTLTDDVDKTVTADPLDYAAGTRTRCLRIPTSGQPISAIWQGWLEAPESGDYNIVIDTDAAAAVSLTIDGTNQNLLNGGSWRNTNVLDLKAGRLYEVRLIVTNVTTTLRVQWETLKRPREVIPGRYLYPATLLYRFAGATRGSNWPISRPDWCSMVPNSPISA